MNNNVSVFTKVLQNLSFRQGLDHESKQFALKYKRKALEITLKHFGDLNFIYRLVLRIYFFTKRTGHSLSVLQCKILLAVITLLSVSVIFYGVYL
ncbi:MAG: hypothetical protein JW864_08950 [Spirochaetes bacterium]|nr:hypothetical protein [Spirochaetota bacterium]